MALAPLHPDAYADAVLQLHSRGYPPEPRVAWGRPDEGLQHPGAQARVGPILLPELCLHAHGQPCLSSVAHSLQQGLDDALLPQLPGQAIELQAQAAGRDGAGHLSTGNHGQSSPARQRHLHQSLPGEAKEGVPDGAGDRQQQFHLQHSLAAATARPIDVRARPIAHMPVVEEPLQRFLELSPGAGEVPSPFALPHRARKQAQDGQRVVRRRAHLAQTGPFYVLDAVSPGLKALPDSRGREVRRPCPIGPKSRPAPSHASVGGTAHSDGSGLGG